MAAAYELYDSPLAADATYDLLARRQSFPNIPGFDPSTGQWVHELMDEQLHELTRWCIAKVDSCPHDNHLHHTYLWEYFREKHDHDHN